MMRAAFPSRSAAVADAPQDPSEAPRPSLQERFAPELACFGCGPTNAQGLRIRSLPEGDHVVARWSPRTEHESYPGMLNGGIVGTLMDCHSNWAAAWHLMNRLGAGTPPCTVTADFHVRLRAPTPTDRELTLRATVTESLDDRATIECTLEADGEVTATCTGRFVAVKPGHPAFHRW
jgi:acyl-coenzyme A thioesterase PaaI-like protein